MPSHVDPAIYVSANLGDLPLTAKAVRALGVKRATAVGHLVLLWGKAAQFAPRGILASLADDQLESWAGWEGKRGRFAAWLRAEHLDPDGRPYEWDEYAGKLAQARELAREKKRQQRRRSPEVVPDVSPGLSRGQEGDGPGDSIRARAEREREREKEPTPPPTSASARDAFLAGMPDERRAGWRAVLDGWPEGLGTPGGRPFPVEQIDAGLAEYLANVAEPRDYAVRHVVRYVEGAARTAREGSPARRGGGSFLDLIPGGAA